MPNMIIPSHFSSGTASTPKRCFFSAQSGELTEETAPSEVTIDQLTTVVTDGERQSESGPISSYVHFYQGVDPFPHQGLTEVLSRKYKIGTYNWSGASPTGTVLGSIFNFPYALLQTSTNLLDKINRFHYFRASVELEFHVAGTMYHQGCLMAAVLPFNNGVVTDPKLTDIWVMSTLDHVHISPDSNTVTKIKIPYLSQTSYWRHDMDENKGYFGTCLIRVLNPLLLQNSLTTPTIPVTVFARFVDPEVMAPTLHAQSGEAKAKSSSGILSKTLEKVSTTVSNVTNKIASSPILQAAVSTGSEALRLGAMMGFDKPDSIESFKPVYLSTVNSLSVMNGMNVVNTLTMDNENAISNKPEDFAQSVQETNFSYLCSQPGLFLQGSFTDSAAADSLIAKWHNSPYIAPATTSVIQYIPCSAVASQFKYWHGDMKYTVYFKTAKFTICKLRISYHPTFSEIVLSPEGSGDFASMVVDVCGDTTISFAIPYCKHEPYSTAHDARVAAWTEDQYAGAISISVVNPIAPLDGDVNQLIYYNIYAAAHPDMDFQLFYELPLINEGTSADYHVIDVTNTTFAPPFVAQSGVKDATLAPVTQFAKDFPYLFPAKTHSFNKVVSGERITNVLDLLHRFQTACETPIGNTPFQIRYPPKDISGLTLAHAFDFFRYWFYFARGGIEYKVTPQYNTTAIDGTMLATNYVDTINTYSTYDLFGRDGTVMENFHFKPSLEISIGQYGIYPYWWREWNYPTAFVAAPTLPTLNAVQFYWYSTGAGAQNDINTRVWIALRDDSSFGYAKGCPKVTMVFSSLANSNTDTPNPKLRRQKSLVL